MLRNTLIFILIGENLVIQPHLAAGNLGNEFLFWAVRYPAKKGE